MVQGNDRWADEVTWIVWSLYLAISINLYVIFNINFSKTIICKIVTQQIPHFRVVFEEMIITWLIKKFHIIEHDTYRILDPILIQLNPVHTSHRFWISRFKLILTLKTISHMWLSSLRFFDKSSFINFSYLRFVYLSNPPHPPRFIHFDIWWRVQVMKFLNTYILILDEEYKYLVKNTSNEVPQYIL
jgi:hypothetical protein